MTFNTLLSNFRIGPSLPPEELICNGPCGLRDFRINSSEDVARVIIRIANLLVYIAVPIAVIMLIWTGFMMLIGQIKNPLVAILNIFIGLGIIVVSFYLTDGFANVVRDSPALLNSLFSNTGSN
jgi:hypothetical protein